MSQKWRSSKMVKVDGAAFKRARLAYKSKDEQLRRGEYSEGSQEWLAEKARLSPRTVNELETGRATLKTVDAVSSTLNIKGRKYILGYGEDFTNIRASGVVDFRPIINGRIPGNEEAYLRQAFLVTLLPIAITVDDDFIDEVRLKNIKLQLFVGDMSINFTWFYNVNLNSRAQTWLGDEEDVEEIVLPIRETYQASIMFKQNSVEAISWKEFIDHVSDTSEKRILLNLIVQFEHFHKEENILISVEEINTIFKNSYPAGYPYWVEPNALMI